jgi:DNA-binding IclR family transcriptional regulator
MKQKAKKDTAVEKALRLLRLLAEMAGPAGVRLVDLVEKTGYPRPTVYRTLRTLREHGFVRQDHDGAPYRLGSLLMSLGMKALGSLDLREMARPELRQLSQDLEVTAHLAVIDGDEVVYIDKIESSHPIRIASGIGWRGKLHCTALGKAMMAEAGPDVRSRAIDAGLVKKTRWTITTVDKLDKELARVRAQGYAVDRQENEPEICCVASSIKDHSGRVVAGISVSGTITQISDDRVPPIGRRVRAACAQISERLGASTRS